MTATDKPTVYIFGEKRKDAPSEPTLTREVLEKIRKNVQQYTGKK